MKKIKIIAGTYGYRKDGSSAVSLITPESDPIELSDEKAERLIKLGVAKEVGENEETATGHLDAESLEEYSVSELKELATKMELTFKPKATKKDLIKLISEAEIEYPVADDDTNDEDAEETNDENAEEPPVLNAVDPE